MADVPERESPYKSEWLQSFMGVTSGFRWVVALTTPKARAGFVYAQESGEFCAYEGNYTRRRGLASYLIKVTVSGEGALTYNGQSYRLPTGSFFWIDCQNPQYYGTAPGASHWSVYCIHLHGGASKIYYDSFMERNHYCPVGILAEMDAATDLIRRITDAYVHASFDYHTDVLASATITSLLSLCLSSVVIPFHSSEGAGQKMPEFLQRVHLYIFERYAEKISLESLANKFYVNKFYLQKQFRQYFGYTPSEYQNLLRVANAKEMLHNTALPVNEIAYKLGLESVSYFIQMFKKMEGTTPQQYRNSWNPPIK